MHQLCQLQSQHIKPAVLPQETSELSGTETKEASPLTKLQREIDYLNLEKFNQGGERL